MVASSARVRALDSKDAMQRLHDDYWICATAQLPLCGELIANSHWAGLLISLMACCCY